MGVAYVYELCASSEKICGQNNNEKLTMIYKIDFLCNILAVIITIGFFIIIGKFIYYKFIVEEIKISKILKGDKFLKMTAITFLQVFCL